MNIKRIVHPHNLWEDARDGMWRKVTLGERQYFAELACNLMSDPDRFATSMRNAVTKWPYACEHNLSDTSINRLAWLGHAGCCVALNSPEDATRMGWWLLADEERVAADEAAMIVVKEWEAAQCQKEQSVLVF